MQITHLMAAHIREVYEGNNWTGVSIADVINDVNWQQAQQKTIGSPNTIASLLHHLYYWNGIIQQRMNGENPSVPETNGFNVGEFNSESDWGILKEKTQQSFMQLAEAVKNFPDIVEHAHYHLGQMVIIKNLLQQVP